ncbi:MAG: hypothetical protein Q9163_000205 [Psora crenata]
MRLLWQEHGEVWIKARKLGTGRKPKIKSEHEELLRKYLDSNPHAYIKDITNHLSAKCGLQVDQSTVWRTMQKRGWFKDRLRPPRLPDSQGLRVRRIPCEENETPTGNEINRRKRHIDIEHDPGRKPKGEKKTRVKADDKLLEKTRAYVKDLMLHRGYDSSHDYAHVQRVTAMAKHILRCEQIAHPDTIYDPLVLEMAALVHDLEDHKYMSSSPGSYQQPHAGGIIHRHHHEQLNDDSARHQEGRGLLLDSCSPPQRAAFPGHRSPITPNQDETPNSATTNEIASAASTEGQTRHQPAFPWPAGIPPPGREPSCPPPSQTSTPPTATAPPVTDPTASQIAALRAHLKTLKTPPHLIHILCTIIPCVSYSYSSQHPDIIHETIQRQPVLAILQDADRLDALGAIGIARAFTFGGARGRSLDDTLRHFHEKLEKLEAGMWTTEGKRLARARTERLAVFQSMWDEEVNGRDYISLPEGLEQERPYDDVVSSHDHPNDETVTSAITEVSGPKSEGAHHTGYATTTDKGHDVPVREIDPELQLMGDMYDIRSSPIQNR